MIGYVATKWDNDCLPISHYGPINRKSNVPQLLIDILPKLILNNVLWIQSLDSMLKYPLSKNRMIQVLKKRPQQFEAKEAASAFLWFFRGVTACDGIGQLRTRLIEASGLQAQSNYTIII